MFVDEIRRQAEAAPRAALPAVAAALWKAFGDGHVSEAEAEALSALIEARKAKNRTVRDLPATGDAQQAKSPTLGNLPARDAAQQLAGAARRAVGSRPRTDASMERRRRWAASGRLPPGLAARFTLAEAAVLALVAAETGRRGDCRLAVGHLAAIVGVAETTVRNAIRQARKLGLVTVEERRVTGFRNDTNVVRIVSPEWQAWLRLARRGGASHDGGNPRPVAKGGGCKSPNRTPTEVLVLSESNNPAPSKSCRGAAGDPRRRDRARIRAGGGAG